MRHDERSGYFRRNAWCRSSFFKRFRWDVIQTNTRSDPSVSLLVENEALALARHSCYLSPEEGASRQSTLHCAGEFLCNELTEGARGRKTQLIEPRGGCLL